MKLAPPTRRRAAAQKGDIRVLRVLTRFNVGGPARQIVAMQEEMARRGVSTALVGGVVQDGEADLLEMLDVEGVVRIPSLGRRVRPWSDLAAIAQLARLIRRERPDVVHTHMAKAGTIGRLAAVVAGVPVRVHTYHGHTLNGYWGRATTGGVVAVERALAPLTSALVAVSRRVRQDLLDRGIGSPERFHVIEAGLELDAYLDLGRGAGSDPTFRRDLGIGSQDQVVAFVGRLVPVKGLDLLLEAMRPILAERPRAHLVVAGDGPDRVLVERFRSELSEARVHLLGWVADVRPLYEAADLVVLSSRNEGTPLSLIEAGAAGLPVVATAVGGVSEVVENHTTGLLVPPNQPEDLAGAIRAVLDDPARAARLGEAGRTAAARFGAGRLAADLHALYARLLHGGTE